MKSLFIPVPLRFSVIAQHFHRLDDAVEIGFSGCVFCAEKGEHILTVFGFMKRRGVNFRSVYGITDILWCKFLLNAIGELPLNNLRGTFPIGAPYLCIVDCLSVYLEPCADLPENVGILIGDGSVRFGTDISEQTAVFGDDIHKVA